MGENVLPTHPVAVGQPNVLLVIATLLAFHRPILHPLLPKPQLHSHQLLLRALLVTIASLFHLLIKERIVPLLIWQANVQIRNFVNSAAITLASVTTEIYVVMPHCRQKEVYCWVDDTSKILFQPYNNFTINKI